MLERLRRGDALARILLEEGGEEIARGGRRLSARKGEARLEEGFGAHLDRRVIEEVKLSALLYTSDHPAEFG